MKKTIKTLIVGIFVFVLLVIAVCAVCAFINSDFFKVLEKVFVVILILCECYVIGFLLEEVTK